MAVTDARQFEFLAKKKVDGSETNSPLFHDVASLSSSRSWDKIILFLTMMSECDSSLETTLSLSFDLSCTRVNRIPFHALSLASTKNDTTMQQYRCDICKTAIFENYDEARHHEKICRIRKQLALIEQEEAFRIRNTERENLKSLLVSDCRDDVEDGYKPPIPAVIHSKRNLITKQMTNMSDSRDGVEDGDKPPIPAVIHSKRNLATMQIAAMSDCRDEVEDGYKPPIPAVIHSMFNVGTNQRTDMSDCMDGIKDEDNPPIPAIIIHPRRNLATKQMMEMSDCRDDVEDGCNLAMKQRQEIKWEGSRDCRRETTTTKKSKIRKNRWVCDVCQVAKFVNYVDAYRHEILCRELQSTKELRYREVPVLTTNKIRQKDESLIGPKPKRTVKWLCGICEVVSFDDYERACQHQRLCAARSRNREPQACVPVAQHDYLGY